MVLAPLSPQREPELRQLLASMNDAPGHARPDNPIIPFQRFNTLHVARLLIVDDRTVDDVRSHGMAVRSYPRYLAFLGDVDGTSGEFLQEVASHAGDGLRALFSCCEGFTQDADLVTWMEAHSIKNAAGYFNWRGRTVQRVREEAALHDALERHVESQESQLAGMPATEVHATLKRLVQQDISAGRLSLSPERPTPLGWRVRNFVHLIGVPVLGLLASPVLLPAAAIGLVRLRRAEKTDPELCHRTPPAHAADLAVLEDHDVTNQFSAMGSLKPGRVRLWTAALVLLAIDYSARHIYTRGGLARVRSIHFARWVFVDRRERIIFFSNYDGSLETYMDDFINKVGFGLNLVFSNGIGYPRTNWLVRDGCSDERKFKEYLRRHQMPTQVWYKAYPGLTAVDLERNGRIRRGLDAASLSERDAREWVTLL
jgi:hypothetical protein